MKEFKIFVIGLFLIVGPLNAHASNTTYASVRSIIKQQILCEKNIITENCADIELQFEALKRSKNVEIIYELYIKQNIQMEMEYTGHCATC